MAERFWGVVIIALVRSVTIIFAIGSAFAGRSIKMEKDYVGIEKGGKYVTASQAILLPDKWVRTANYIIQAEGIEIVCFDSNYGFLFVKNTSIEISNGRPCMVFILTEGFDVSNKGEKSFAVTDKVGNVFKIKIRKWGNSFYLIPKITSNWGIHEIIYRQWFFRKKYVKIAVGSVPSGSQLLF